MREHILAPDIELLEATSFGVHASGQIARVDCSPGSNAPASTFPHRADAMYRRVFFRRIHN